MEKKQIKAIALLSGGLDSVMAIKLLLNQGIEVIGLNFMSPFCTCTPKTGGCKSAAVKAADQLGIKLRIIHQGMDYLKMVENPKFGYGKGLNCCIDCRINYFRGAKKVMEEEGADFIVSGEVVGQRPMSQKKHVIEMIEKEAGLENLVLRPLCWSFFENCKPVKEKMVDTSLFPNIHGRDRKIQIELAKENEIKEFYCGSGGCMLTEPMFASKLQDLYINYKNFDMKDVHLIKTGRHFRINDKIKIIVGKDETEDGLLKIYGKNKEYLVLEPDDFTGPTALIYADKNVEELDLETFAQIVLFHTKVEEGNKVEFTLLFENEPLKKVSVNKRLFKEEVEKFRISSQPLLKKAKVFY